MQQGAPIQYRVDVCAEPPLVRIAAKCGPLEIPLDLDLAKAEALLDSLDQAIDRISPKNGDETVEVTVESEPLADDLAALLTQARANVEARAAERGLILGT